MFRGDVAAFSMEADLHHRSGVVNFPRFQDLEKVLAQYYWVSACKKQRVGQRT